MLRTVINEVKAKLSRLGMCLFFFYVLLIVVGCTGIAYGFVMLLLHCINVRSALNVSIWQTILAILACWFMIKIFLRECYNLLGIKNIGKILQSSDENVTINSNVIPIRKNSPW